MCTLVLVEQRSAPGRPQRSVTVLGVAHQVDHPSPPGKGLQQGIHDFLEVLAVRTPAPFVGQASVFFVGGGIQPPVSGRTEAEALAESCGLDVRLLPIVAGQHRLQAAFGVGRDTENDEPAIDRRPEETRLAPRDGDVGV